MQCPKCQFDNPDSMKFCGQCGAKLENVCPECGFANPPGFQFCGECGTRISEKSPRPPLQGGEIKPAVPRLEDMRDRLYIPEPLRKRMDSAMQEMEGENRIITALFADISGFTAMSQELSPEDAVEKVNQCFQAITDAIYRYEGNINRFIGDCVLAFFGAPIAHEDDPERAIMSGLDMLDAVHQLGLEIKVGINTGMMYFGPIGTQEHREISAYGEDINLAKRLQEEAQPGQVIVGERTYRFTRKAFEFEILQQLTLRGVKIPVRAYSAIKQLPKPEKIRGIEGLRARMIGRDEELARLKDMLDEVMHSRGQMVSIIGEAGVGKSRLVAELKSHTGKIPLNPPLGKGERERILENGEGQRIAEPLILEGRCLSLGVTASYWPFIDIFREYFGWGTDDSDRTRGDSIVSKLRDMVDRGDLTEDRYDEIGPMLGNLLSVQFGTDWDDRLKNADPQQIRHRTFMAVRDFFMALSRQHPLILVFEDLHWSDSLSLDLISLLMEALTLVPLFLVCVYRPEKEHRSWHLGTIASQKCSERYTELHLRELTHQQSRRLVESLLRIDNLPSSVKEMILQKSQGNPFFVEEVIRSLIEMGMVYREDDRWHAREGIESIAVPETIQSVILSRIDRLEDELRHVLQSASVIGRLFRRSLLERVTQQESELERDLWDLEEHELIYQERIVPEEEYSFKHAFTQETVYESILSRRRAEIHQEIAESMELLYGDNLDEYYEELAYHYSRSRSAEKAIEYLLKAGEKAKISYANDTAISYFQQVLDTLEQHEVDRDDWKLAALRGLGEVYQGIGKVAKAEMAFAGAIELAGKMKLPPRQLASLYGWIAQVMWWQSRPDEEIRYGEIGLEILRDDIECMQAAVLNANIGIGNANKGNPAKWREYIYKNMAFIKRLDYSAELVEPYTHIIYIVYADEDSKAGWDWAKELETRAQEHHDLRGLAKAWLEQGGISTNEGDYRSALSLFQKGFDMSEHIGDVKQVGECQGGVVGLHGGIVGTLLDMGDVEGAGTHGQEYLKIAKQVGNPYSIAWAHRHLGCIAMCRHDWEEALSHFQRLLEEWQVIGNPYMIIRAHLPLGRAYMKKEDYHQALHCFEEIAKSVYLFPYGLAGIEEAYIALGTGEEHFIERSAGFMKFCHSLKERHPDIVEKSSLHQWYLEPTEPVTEFSLLTFADDFRTDIMGPAWVWTDEFGDCAYGIADGGGLETRAANGRDLSRLNLSAPRLMREISGNFAIEACISQSSDDKPQQGGLLVWKDRNNLLRFERGTYGQHEMRLQGYVDGQWQVAGRGMLVTDEDQEVHLRLERIGDEFTSYCSMDGEHWLTCGKMTLPLDDPIQVGIHAIGMIDRTIYCGAYKEGTATVFRNFRIWTK